ncbi:MAG: hypothetical protein U9Q83_07060 [Bacteroidota bacterium]|nr:hypothetical protein [Bacteroidota bacterium]
MKTKLTLTFLLALFFSFSLVAQNADDASDDNSDFEIPDIEHVTEGIRGNFNLSTIGDQYFIGFRFKPELSFGKLGFGLDMPLLLNLTTKELRLDEFQDGVGALRMIRFVRFGVKKRDAFYFRIGELSDARLGFGMILNDYNNSISFEKRKLGAEFDIVIKEKFGLEVIYSDLNFASLNLLGIRPYFKPFGATKIPIVKTIEIGAGFVTDHDKTAIAHDDIIDYRSNYFIESGINSFAVDMGLYLLNFNWLRWNIYAQAGYMPKITGDSLTNYIDLSTDNFVKDYKAGSGWGIGSDFKFKFIGNLIRVNFRAERYWHSDYYKTRFFDFAYELNKDESVLTLINSREDQGMYFNLGATVLDKVVLQGNIIFDDQINEEHPALMSVGLDMSGIVDKLTFYTSMQKAELTSFSDIFKFDDATLFNTFAAWRVFEVPVVNLQFDAGIDIKWTYAFLSNGDFEATRYVSPFFAMKFVTDKKKAKNKEPGDISNQ